MNRPRHLALLGLAAALAALPYLHTAAFPFVAEDKYYVAANPYLRSPSKWGLFFTRRYWAEMHPYRGSAMRPLLAVSLGVDASAFGYRPAAFHLTNVLLHALASALVGWVVWLFSRRGAAMWMSAALFAAWPAHVEAVAWVKNRSEMLAAAFALAGLAGLAAARGPVGRGAAAAAGYALSMLCKLSAAGWPLLAPAYERVVRGRPRPFVAAGAAAVVLAAGAWYVSVARGQGPAKAPSLRSPIAQAAQVVRSAACYARFSLFGAAPGLYPDASPNAWSAGLSLCAALLVAAAAWRAARPRGAAAFWAFAFLVSLVPILNFAPLASRPVALQRAYLPSAAAAAFLALAIRDRRAAALALAAVVLSSALAVRRSFAFDSDRALYCATVRTAPDKDYVWLLCGDAYLKAGRPARAERLLLRARARNRFRAMTDYNLASAYLRVGRLDDALVAACRADANGLGPRAWLLEGECFERLGALALAARSYARAAQTPRVAAYALNNLGNVRVKQGRYDEAAQLYRRALKIRPSLRPARASLAALNAWLRRRRSPANGGGPK